MSEGTRLGENLERVRDEIAGASARSGRDPGSVTLVAVTKRRPEALVRALDELGVRAFGENYPQELWEKAGALPDLRARWHLIGHLQGNKVGRTAPMVAMIHGVDSLRLLAALDTRAGSSDSFPDVCLQVNISDEDSKHGWTPEELLADAEAIASRNKLRVVGLMTMAALGTDAESARPTFSRMRGLRDELRKRTDLALPHLSMGMSGDFVAAIEEGATLVRVGSALFEGVDP